MLPQMSLMHALILDCKLSSIGVFGVELGWGGPAGIVIGHLAYGAVMGGLYVSR